MTEIQKQNNKKEPNTNTDSFKKVNNNVTQPHNLNQSYNCISSKDLFSMLDIQKVFSELKPENKGSYYTVNCPECGKNEAYIYKNSQSYIKCSRLNNCGAEISLWNYIKTKNSLKDNKSVYKELSKIAGVEINFIEKYEDNPKELKTILKEISFLKVTDELINNFNKYLLNNQELLLLLKEKTGINKNTIENLKIGFSQPHDMWVFPAIDFNDNIFGAEFRTKYFTEFIDYDNRKSKVKRPTGTDSKLCKINNHIQPKDLIVIEGFKDAYTIYQYLKKHQLDYNYQIVTPSCGVGSIPNLLKSFDISPYNKVILSLDNDKAGKETFKNCINKLDFLIYELKLPYSQEKFKDFNDWYLIENNKEKNIFDNNEYTVTPALLSLAKQYIKSKGLSHNYKVQITEKIKLIKQIIVYDNCYFEIWTQEEDNKIFLNYKRLTNFHINFLNEIINFDDKEQQLSSLEVEIIKENGDKSNKFKLEGSSKQDIQEFVRSTSIKGTYANLLNSTHLAKIIDKLNILNKLYCYETTGLITKGIKNNSKLWLYSNCAVNMKTGEIQEANKEGIINIENTKIKPEIKTRKFSTLNLTCKNKYTPQEIADKLIENLFNSYNRSIEPFLIMGTALLAPFRDTLKMKTNDGFPVCFIYGSAKSGKTSLAKLICSLYGFNENYITLGTSTDNAIIDELGKSSRIPVIIDEYPIKNKFEELVKSIYECIPRELMKRNGIDKISKPINSTAIFISNYAPPENEQVMSRLNFTTFNSQNFFPTEACKFNEIKNNYLCFLLPEFLSISETKILEDFDNYNSIIKGLNLDMSSRDINNLSIAYTGIMLLFEIAKRTDSKEIINLINERIENFNDLCKTESAIDVLLKYLTTLKNNGKLIMNKDYKFTTDNKLALYLSDSLLNAFSREYKIITGNTAPTKKEILNSAKNDSRIENHNNNITNPVNLDGKIKRCLIIDITENEELKDLDQNSHYYKS